MTSYDSIGAIEAPYSTTLGHAPAYRSSTWRRDVCFRLRRPSLLPKHARGTLKIWNCGRLSQPAHGTKISRAYTSGYTEAGRSLGLRCYLQRCNPTLYVRVPNIHTYIHTYIYIYTYHECIYIYIYIYIYIHSHVQPKHGYTRESKSRADLRV